MGRQNLRPHGVVLLSIVVAGAVDLHSQVVTWTAEVHDESPEGMLSAKAQTMELLPPDRLPQDSFSRSQVAPKLTCGLPDLP